MKHLKPLIPLLLTAGILIGGNGLQGTFISLRGHLEGFSTSLIGIVGTGYYLGFAIGCIYVTRIMRAIGHIRAFSALAAIASASSLAMVLVIQPGFWFAMRLISGFCFAGLFAVVESWLNARVTNENRARTLSIYRFVDLGSVTAAQYLIPTFGISGFDLFAIISIALTLSLVPISFADRTNPPAPDDFPFSLLGLWRISPLAAIGCIAVGLSNSTFRALGPIYAQGVGFSVTDIATFMSVGIFGGVMLQYPLGHYSDRLDRRLVILTTTTGALASALFIEFVAGSALTLNLAGIFAFGAFAMPLYSLCSAHANDHAAEGQHAVVSAGTLFYWSIGAIVGPMIASVLVDRFGPTALFSYMSVVLIGFLAFSLLRIGQRKGVPLENRPLRFSNPLRTSSFFTRRQK